MGNPLSTEARARRLGCGAVCAAAKVGYLYLQPFTAFIRSSEISDVEDFHGARTRAAPTNRIETDGGN